MSAQSNPWPLAEPADVGVRPDILDGELAPLLAANKTCAAALVVDGKLIWERYWHGYDQHSRFDTRSVAKSFAAVAIGLLVDDGKLALDDPACKYLPEWREDDRRKITIRHLLTMSSGLHCDFAAFCAEADSTGAALRWPLEFPPGEVWSYEQATMQALCPIIVRLTGMQPIDLLRQRILNAIGARELGWDRDINGDCLAWRSILTSARDLARWGWLLLEGGNWNGRPLISRGYLDQMTQRDPIVSAARTSPGQKDFRRRSWGFGLFVNTDAIWEGVDRSNFAPLGAGGNLCLVDRPHRMVLTRLTIPEGTTDLAAYDSPIDATDTGTSLVWRTALKAMAG